MENKKNNRLRKYHRPFPIDPGVFIFVLIAIYILVCVVLYLVKPHVSVYEVQYGEIAQNHTYTGLILRQEQVVFADASGYITYYAREGQKAGVKTTVYTIDETGKMTDLLEEAKIENTTLSPEDMKKLEVSVQSFQSSYSDMDFASTYSFKQNVESMALEFINVSLLDSISESDNTSGLLNIYKSASDGVLSYGIDGYESVTPDTITKDLLGNSDSYSKTDLRKQKIVNVADPIYKLITDDEWMVVIELDKETAQTILEEEYLEVTFLKDHTTAWAKITTWEKDGTTFAGLTFTNSMIRFALDRYLTLEFKLDSTTGLKIPASSIVEKSFYTIPVEYLTYGGNDNDKGVYLESYSEDGSIKQEFVKLDIYKSTDEFVYVSTTDFNAGNVLIKPESLDRFTIGKMESLIGVYNINKGYAVFNPITILYESNDYCIVKSDTTYGLSKYDHIVLDGTTVEDGATLYR